jgi:hypothetical protein
MILILILHASKDLNEKTEMGVKQGTEDSRLSKKNFV